MFIAKKAPVQFSTGDILSPEALNENNGYFTKAFSQIADAQTCRWSTSYSFVPNASTTLSSATSIDFNTKFIPTAGLRAINSSPAVIIESVTVNAYYTATVPFTLTVGSGAAAETITFPVRDASLATEPFLGGNFVTLFNIVAVGTVLSLGTLPAGVSITKFDVTVGYSSDKYTSGNYTSTLSKPTLSLPRFTDASVADATVFSGMKTTLETAATNAIAGVPCRWIAAEFNNITSATSASLRYRALPALAFGTANSPIGTNLRIIGAYLSAAGTGLTAGDTIRYGLANNVGTYNPETLVSPTQTFGTGAASWSINIGTKVASLGASVLLSAAASTVANDQYIYITVTGTATVVAATVYLLVQ
jgi:hypothetical protein